MKPDYEDDVEVVSVITQQPAEVGKRSEKISQKTHKAPKSEEEALEAFHRHVLDTYGFDPRKAIATATSSSSRSSFIAGWMYYEIARNGFFGTDSDASANYLRAQTGSFLFAVISVTVASYISRYIRSVEVIAKNYVFFFT